MDVYSGNATLACSTGGVGEPSVLLLHAGVTDRRSWQHLTPLLPRRWVSYDARGFGETTYTREDGWSAVADSVAVLDAHGIDRAVLVGSSIGGRTALDLALTHPDRVAGLVLIGPAISGAPEPVIEPAAASLMAEYDAAEEAEDLELINRIEAHVWLDGALQTEGRVAGPTRELFSAMNATALAAPDPGERHADALAWDRLAEISVPTLVLIGEHDLMHMREWAERIAAGVADGRRARLPGVAHLPQVEADAHCLGLIAEFVAGRS